jgi:uncharacterized protein YggL (DUF469 family)
MGVPLSNYTVLKFLADGVDKEKANRHSFEIDYALAALENYGVFAFIVHDPLVHKEFHEFFQKQFKSLHYSSGQHLVFFGLVDSPKNYCLTGNQLFYSDVRDAIELFEEEEENEADYSYSAFALAHCLDIPPEMLPAIVITHDTRLTSHRWYKTCPDKIETQMNRLTGISNQMNHFKQNDKLPLEEKQKFLYKLLDEQDLDLCNGMGTTTLNESMARALSDLMSFLIEEEKSKYYDSSKREIIRLANNQKRSSLDKALKSLHYLKLSLKEVDIADIGNHSMYPLIEDLNIKLAIYWAK